MAYTVTSDIAAYAKAVLEWPEKHAGLGGWIGAFGAVVAIFVTWGLARAEYLRNKRQRIARVDEEIALIIKIVREFDAFVSEYAEAAFANQPEAPEFYNRHMNDAEFHAMRDLASLPVTQWPSFSTYSAFKTYWYFSLRVLETSNFQPVNVDSVRTFLPKRDESLKTLNQTLSVERSRLPGIIN